MNQVGGHYASELAHQQPAWTSQLGGSESDFALPVEETSELARSTDEVEESLSSDDFFSSDQFDASNVIASEAPEHPPAEPSLAAIDDQQQPEAAVESDDFLAADPSNRIASVTPVPGTSPHKNSTTKSSTPKNRQRTPGPLIGADSFVLAAEPPADGTLLLSENTLITGSPLNVLPYVNFFAGFDRPQSAARAAQAGGILRNTGILFESDGMTNFPTLDATGNDTVGGALGLNLLANDFRQQLVAEMAFLNVIGNDATRIAAGDQYGIGMRYQLPLNNSVIFRTDAMYGFCEDAADVHGVRMELRKKF